MIAEPPDPRAHCPTCRQRHPPPVDDGWGELMDWWDCWTCMYCSTDVCNMPIRNDGTTCYVKHLETHHPDVYKTKSPA